MVMAAPGHLRVEHLDHPLGITVAVPRLSWRLPSGSRRQLAYRVRAGQWDSRRVESAQSVLVPYGGPHLRSAERVVWTVKVWTDAGESDWAEPAWWEMGLLGPSDWVAAWVEPPESPQARERSPRPAWLLRGTATVPGPIAHARLYATAHGIYEVFVNGHRVGDAELTPGLTSYHTRLQVQTFEVTALLRPGPNAIGMIVSDGWFRGQTAGPRLDRTYGDRVAVLAQLHAEGPDGSVRRVGTGPDWVAAVGAIHAADLIEGQVVDLRDEPQGWCQPGADLDGWTPVEVGDYDRTRLTGSPAPSVRRVQEIRPVAVWRPAPGRQVVDLGQNLNGWVRLTNLGPAGTTLTLTHGETLDAAGDVTTRNVATNKLDPAMATLPWDFSKTLAPFQVDRVTSAGRPGEAYEPRHTTHGFRYVRVQGHPGELTADDVTGVVVHTDLRRTGWFACSDERINRLHEAAVWSFRGNACDIPTDCPTRERSGWTGDWQVFVPTAAFLYDVAGFATKWLRDLAAEQRPDGVVLHSAPELTPVALQVALGMPPGSAGWGDAAVIVPWEIYRAYGDVRLLQEQWPSMAAWVEHAARVARERRHPSRIAARPTPAPHEQHLWDTGFHWGEWLEPGALVEFESDDSALRSFTTAYGRADYGEVATAYLHRSAHLLSRMAAVVGRDADAARYGALAVAAKAAWQAEFVRPDGTLTCDTQAAHVRALAFSLVPDALRARVAERLVALVRKADTHLGTGFLATAHLLPVLADTGHLDVAYELLFQDTEPSWLTMIDRGATTMWEHWGAIGADGLPSAPGAVGSLNHYSKGVVISFLHRYVAGIQQLEEHVAYRRFRIAPRPGGGLTSAWAAHECPYGRIESAWRMDGDRFALDVAIPPGTTAQVVLPDGSRHEAEPGHAAFTCVTSASTRVR